MREVLLRDTRRTDWFWVQHVLIDVFQPVIGPLGVTVYNALCREVANNVQTVDVSMRELGEMATVGKDTAQRMLAKMRVLGMVQVRSSRRGRTQVDLCDLNDASGLPRRPQKADIEAAILQMKKKLSKADMDGSLKPAKKSRQEEALEAPGLFDELTSVSEGDTEDVETVEEGPKSVSLGETDCLKNGGSVSQKQPSVSQNETPYLLNTEERNKKEETLLNPPVGRTSLDLGLVLDEIGRLKQRQGDVSDLREQIAEHMAGAGFEVLLDAWIADRGDGHAGRVDLWCSRGPVTNAEFVVIECDAATARDKSLMKLRRLGEGIHRVLVLRTATIPQSYDRIDRVIALGWPGNGHVSAGDKAAAAQQARAAVGSSSIAAPAAGQHSIGPASVRTVFAAVRAQVEGIAASMGFLGNEQDVSGALENPLAEWDRCFGTIAYERHEAVEGSAGGTLLVLASDAPKMTLTGLQTYQERLVQEMHRVFGCAVQVQVVDSG